MIRWLIIDEYRPGAILMPSLPSEPGDATIPRAQWQILQHATEEAIQIKDQDGNIWDGIGWNWEDVPVEGEWGRVMDEYPEIEGGK